MSRDRSVGAGASASSRTTDTKDVFGTFAKTLPYAVGVFGLAFVASAVTATIMTPVKNSDATSSGVNADINAVAYYVNIASSGTVSKDIQATYNGTRGVITDTLTVKSNTPDGYQVYVSMANNTYGQYLPLVTDDTTSPVTYSDEYHLAPVSGYGKIDTTAATSLSNPTVMDSSNLNTWGIAVPGNLATLKSDSDFSVPAAYNDDTVYTDSNISDSTYFAPVPAYGSEQLLYAYNGDTVVSGADTDTSLATTHSVPVYYGFYANSGMPSGTYQNTVLYTAYAESATSPTAATSSSVSPYTNSSQTVRFVTSLYTDREVDADNITVTIGQSACTNVATSKVSAGTNDSVVVTCTAPAQPGPGDYTAKIEISDYDHTSTATIAYADTSPASTMVSTVAASNGNGNIYYAVNEMQDFAAYEDDYGVTATQLCAGWEDTPDAFTSAGVGYTYGNSVTETQIKADPTNTSYWTSSVAGAAQMTGINSDVPEATLTDNRDGNTYRIRKLADGNCWMTQNLKLVFDTDGVNSIGKIDASGNIVAQNPVVTINSSNTNVSDSWNSSTFASDMAYTETASNKTVWGATDGGTTKHPTGTSVSASDDASARAMTYLRSYYRAGTVSTLDSESQDYGVYYNWRAATAGTGTTSVSSGDVADSICPAGWRLPKTGEFQTLIYTVYGAADLNTGDRRVSTIAAANATYKDYHTYAMTDALRRAPLSFPLSGFYLYYSAGLGGTGLWWSSTANSSVSARYLVFVSGLLLPQHADRKGVGFTVRCIAE